MVIVSPKGESLHLWEQVRLNEEALEQVKAERDLLESDLNAQREEIKRMQEEYQQQEQEILRLKKEAEMLRNDPWSSRVTYENVVELIAGNEDPAQRDIARKVFEPLLKREQVRQLRRDVKKKVKEMELADGPDIRTFNNYGTYNELKSGELNLIELK